MRPRSTSSVRVACSSCCSRSCLLFGLANAYGQSPTGSEVDSPAALLEVSAPVDVRGGLYFQGRFRITAHEDIAKATLVLAPGWLESMHINTIEPAPRRRGEPRRRPRARLRPRRRGRLDHRLPAVPGQPQQPRPAQPGRPALRRHRAARDRAARRDDLALGAHGHRRQSVLRVSLRLSAHAADRAARALLARAVRPDPARRRRRLDAAGHHAERHVVHGRGARNRHVRA